MLLMYCAMALLLHVVKAIIVESNYRINGITRYQRGLAAYQFLMRISQH